MTTPLSPADGVRVDDVAGMKTARTGGVVRAGAVMAVATLVSRLTGFLSKVVLLSVLGFGIVNDAYTLANTLPNIVFELLIGGVLTSVAIPLLSRARSDPDGGEGYTQRLMTAALVGLLIATALAVLAAPLLTRLYLSGDSLVDVDLANSLAYLLLPQIFFYGVAALFGAILNTKEKFGVPAWAPVANNLVVIAVGIALHLMPSGGTTADGSALSSLTREQFLLLSLGTTAGIVMQAVVMLPALRRSGFRFKWRWGGDRRLLEAGRLMLWAVVYVLISQAGYVVVTNVASRNVEGGISLYAFASMLFQLPYGIIGVSILTAIMPRMSRHAAAGQIAEMKDDASLANRLSIVALTPIAAGIMVLAGALAIIASLYGAVSLDDTLVLGSTLAALALGLVPFAVTLVQMRVFYAMKDGRTPALINAIMVAVRIPLLIVCAGLDESLIIPGMAIATSISYLVGAIAGEIWLRSRYGRMGTRRTLVTLLKMTVAGGAGAGAALLAAKALLPSEVDDLGEAVLEILVSGTVGLLVIAAVGTALKVEELVPLRNRIAGRAARILRRGSPNPGAAPNVKDTDGGTLAGDTYSPADPADPAHGRHEQRTMAMTTVIDIQSDPHSSSREQVANPVPNDSGGPAVRGADRDSDTETVVTDHDPAASTVLTERSADETLVTVHDDDPAPADDMLDPPLDSESTTVIPAEQTLPTTSGQVARLDGAAPELTPGTTIGGRYRLVSLVSADNSGHWFWRAKDTVLPRDMAVTMLPDTSGASATVARTLRAGRLHHIGLPQTLDVGTDHGQSYVVGQWVDGATLTDLLSGGPLEADVATSITAKLSEAVAEAHRNGVAFGAINPSLVRVNFDGQVRLSHVIAHGSATPDQDIKAIGALLYLMLTGTWPLGDPIKPGGAGSADGTTTGRELAAAPTRLGRELPADEVRPDVPEALSALAERALHPEEPDGIHAVGAIAALLRSPETVAGIAQAPPVPEAKPLSPADRRLIKERRVKLSLASVVLAVFAVLIVIAIGGLTNQFVASIQNSAPDELPIIDSTVSPTDASPTPAADPATTADSAAPSATGATSVAVKPVAGLVFDPQGDGTPDYKDYVDRAFDGNPDSAWLTWVYKGQFPSLKTGVGLLLELDHETTPTSVTVNSATNGTVIEIRSAASPTTTLDQTTVLGSGTVAGGTVTIPLTAAPKSKYLIVFVTKMAPTSDNQFQSKINEVSVQGS
jgi:putative peptidoglycan lipid II flippase